jgi:hypothetical protein
MFLEFQTTGGPLFVNADKIVSYQHDDEQEFTTLQTSDGGAYAVLEHPTMITKALETHTCVLRVLELHVVPESDPRGINPDVVSIDRGAEGGSSTKVVVRDLSGQVLGEWETDHRGAHTPS